MAKLNIGCGNVYEPDWVNTEITKQVKADFYFDAGKDPWPFEDNTFDEAKAQMVFEHLPDYTARIHFLKEIHRVCKADANIFLTMPHFSCGGCWQDMQHVRGFGSQTFDYVSINKTSKISIMHNQEIEGNNRLFVCTPRIKFGRFFTKFLFMEWFANAWHTKPIYELLLAYIFPSQEIHFNLKVVK